MTYEVPMKDGKIDYVQLAFDVDALHSYDRAAEFIFKALVNHALEEAADIVKLYPANKTTADIVREIRALKEPTDD